MAVDLEDQNLIPGGGVQICLFTLTGMFLGSLRLVSKRVLLKVHYICETGGSPGYDFEDCCVVNSDVT
jgi:hypothetical protein